LGHITGPSACVQERLYSLVELSGLPLDELFDLLLDELSDLSLDELSDFHWTSYLTYHWTSYLTYHWMSYPTYHWTSYPTYHWTSYPTYHYKNLWWTKYYSDSDLETRRVHDPMLMEFKSNLIPQNQLVRSNLHFFIYYEIVSDVALST